MALFTRRSLWLMLVFVALAPISRAQFVEGCQPIHTIQGQNPGEQFGWVSERLDDVDGDGLDDLAITAPFGGGSRVDVHSGGTGALLYSIAGQPGEALGYSIDRAGDLNQDGVGDILIGAPQNGTGRVYVFSGVDGSVIRTYQGEATGDQFGYGVGLVGDVDGDDLPDYVIGAINHDAAASNAGRAYLVSGDGTTLFTFDGPAANDFFGSGVGGIGDVNGDEIPDIAIGAMNVGPGNRGRTFVHSGADGALLYAVNPDASGTNFGQYFVKGVGFVDGDDTPDFFVADFADSFNGGGSGKAYVYSGINGARIHTFVGQNAGDGIGPGRGAGDVNRDGHDDLIIAAWSSSEGAPTAGAVFVFSGLDGSVIRKYTGNVGGVALGFDAHAFGDVDGDGALDYVLTGASASGGRGIVHVVPGGTSLQPPKPGDAGVFNTFHGKGAVPGTDVLMLFGLSLGSLPFPGCADLTLDLGWPFFAFVLPVDAQGTFSIGGDVPPELSGVTLHTQALELSRCAKSLLSSHTFP